VHERRRISSSPRLSRRARKTTRRLPPLHVSLPLFHQFLDAREVFSSARVGASRNTLSRNVPLSRLARARFIAPFSRVISFCIFSYNFIISSFLFFSRCKSALEIPRQSSANKYVALTFSPSGSREREKERGRERERLCLRLKRNIDDSRCVATTEAARETPRDAFASSTSARATAPGASLARYALHCSLSRVSRHVAARRIESSRVASRRGTRDGHRAKERTFRDLLLFLSLSLSLSFSLLLARLFRGGNQTISNARPRHDVTNARDRPRDSKTAGCQHFSGAGARSHECRFRSFTAVALERDVHAPPSTVRELSERAVSRVSVVPPIGTRRGRYGKIRRYFAL